MHKKAKSLILVTLGCISAFPGAIAADLFTENFNNVTSGIFNGGQLDSELDLAYNAVIPNWNRSGFNAVHIVDRANPFFDVSEPRNFAPMFYADNQLELNAAVAGSNTAGQVYTVSYKLSPAVYQIEEQKTQANDLLILELIEGPAGRVVASRTVAPGAWIDNVNFRNDSFSYRGDGTDDLRIRIRADVDTIFAGRFAGAVDDIVLSTGGTLAPQVTLPADGITNTSATLHATVNANGGNATVAFEYGFFPSRFSQVPAAQPSISGSTGSSASTTLTGLQPHTTYNFRIAVTDAAGKTTGAALNFTTANTAPTAPNATVAATTGDAQTYDISFPTFDDDGDPVFLLSATSGSGINVDSFSGNSVTFTPAPGFAGTGNFTYTVQDTEGATATGTITVTVTNNDAPQTVAILSSGDPVPGAGVSGSGIPAGSRFIKFGTPAISDSGDIAYTARWNTPRTATSPAQTSAGIFAGNPAVLVARVGGEAMPGVRFIGFGDPVINADGKIAFSAALAGTGITAANYEAIFTDAFGPGLSLVAQRGDVADASGAQLAGFTGLSLQGGEVLFTSFVTGGAPAAGPLDSRVAIRATATEKTLIIRSGMPYGTTRVKDFNLLNGAARASAQNRAHTEGNAAFSVRLRDGSHALVDSAGGTLTPFASSGQTTGGTTLPLAKFRTFNSVAADSTFATMYATAVEPSGAGKRGIFLGVGSVFEPVALAGQSTGIPGTTFSVFSDPVLGPETGAIAFTASLGGAVQPTEKDTLWWKPSSEPLRLVARAGTHAEGTPSGALWKTFFGIGLSGGANGAPLFIATLAPGAGGVTNSNDTGLWAVDSYGSLHLIVREGSVIAGKTVSYIDALTPVPRSKAVTRTFNNTGLVTFKVRYTDFTQSVITVQLP